VFNNDLENYVYTYQKAGGAVEKQNIKIHYKADIYQNYEGKLLDNNPAY
jgi:outer membrane protein assembly factor BamE